MLDKPIDILCSFHYFAATDLAQMHGWGCRIIGDSGAYSALSQGAVIDLDAFYEWVARWRSVLFWAASLDVIGDAEASWQNWRDAPEELGLVPTVHYGADPEELDRYAEAGVTLVGLGGMVPFRGEPKRLMRWCLSMMRYAEKQWPDLRFHGWGVTHPLLLENLPWYSIDSSGFSAAYRYGRMTLFDPDRKRRVSVMLDGKASVTQHRLLAKHYGLDSWEEAATSSTASRRLIVRLSLRSYQLYGEWLRDRRPVSPPARLAGDDGPRMHATLGRPPDPAYTSLRPAGPLIHAALGAPSMQPARSLNPTDEYPAKAGPMISAAVGRDLRFGPRYIAEER